MCLEDYRKAGKIAGKARDLGCEIVKEGLPVLELAERVEAYIIEQGADLAFPVNIDINDIAAHFTPTHDCDLKLKKGDVVKVDVGAQVNGYIGDTAATVEVGTSDNADLIKASREALNAALEVARPGLSVNILAGAVEDMIKSRGYLPVHNLTGHQVDQYIIHAGFSVPSIRTMNTDRLPNKGAIAIEPFATNGSAGEVTNGPIGNIYRLQRVVPKQKDIMEQLVQRTRGLPFSERLCHSITEKSEKHLKRWSRMRAVYAYPILVERTGGMVSQTEHTIWLEGDGCEILTK